MEKSIERMAHAWREGATAEQIARWWQIPRNTVYFIANQNRELFPYRHNMGRR